MLTPEKDILSGITRQKIIELCQKNDIDIVECDISKSDLYSAREVFITATTKRVLPVVKVDNETINSGQVGPVTKQIIDLYNDYTQKFLSRPVEEGRLRFVAQ